MFSQQAMALAACQALLAIFPGQLHWPDSADYTTASTGVWSKTCVLTPECVFEPRTVQALSSGVKMIKEHKSKFAVRSGGHMSVPGAQSVDQGIMISMSNFNAKSLNDDRSVASIGPGQLWGEVYDWLDQFDGLTVNGGRYPMVGVGGVLMGGGMGYFAGQRGWSVDDIVGWEVVLADGKIVNVTVPPAAGDPYSYDDLAWALRGGHNHFGIVTRFDMRTFAAKAAYGGLQVYSAAAQDLFLDALDTYMAPGGGSDDPKSAINPASILQFVNGEWVRGFLNVQMYADGDTSPRALENFTSIPAEHVIMSAAGLHENWTAIPKMLAGMVTQIDRTLFWAITFKADRRAVDIANEVFYVGATNELKHVEGLLMTISFQPLTMPFLQASKDKGGNLMGLDPGKDGRSYAGILFPTWKKVEDDEAVLAFTQKAAKKIEEETRKLGLYNPYIFLNDAAKGQRPFEKYADGANLGRLQTIQTKYDLEGFFRNYLQHGFELGTAGWDHREL